MIPPSAPNSTFTSIWYNGQPYGPAKTRTAVDVQDLSASDRGNGRVHVRTPCPHAAQLSQ
jgi:hypothetical protein